MSSKISQKQFKNFLRERKLTASFNRFKKIKRKRIINININEIRKSFVVYKKGKKTIISDLLTLKTLATTTKFNTKNIEKGFIKRKISFKRKFKGRDIKAEQLFSPIKLKEIEITPLTNVNFIRRGNPLKTKRGKLTLVIKFIKYKPKRQQIVTSTSRKLKNFSDAGHREKAFNEAFQGALPQINFSYDTFIIIDKFYDYFIQRSDK